MCPRYGLRLPAGLKNCEYMVVTSVRRMMAPVVKAKRGFSVSGRAELADRGRANWALGYGISEFSADRSAAMWGVWYGAACGGGKFEGFDLWECLGADGSLQVAIHAGGAGGFKRAASSPGDGDPVLLTVFFWALI